MRPRTGRVIPGEHGVGATGEARPHNQHLRKQAHDGEACGDSDPGRRRLDGEARDDGCCQRELAGVERAKNQASDAEPDLQGDTGGTELQWGLDKRDRQHHAQPHKGRGGRDGGCCIHGQQPTVES